MTEQKAERKEEHTRAEGSAKYANRQPQAEQLTTLLIGDSMVQNIQGRKQGKAVGHRVVVKSFSGANTRAMSDYF